MRHYIAPTALLIAAALISTSPSARGITPAEAAAATGAGVLTVPLLSEIFTRSKVDVQGEAYRETFAIPQQGKLFNGLERTEAFKLGDGSALAKLRVMKQPGNNSSAQHRLIAEQLQVWIPELSKWKTDLKGKVESTRDLGDTDELGLYYRQQYSLATNLLDGMQCYVDQVERATVDGFFSPEDQERAANLLFAAQSTAKRILAIPKPDFNRKLVDRSVKEINFQSIQQKLRSSLNVPDPNVVAPDLTNTLSKNINILIDLLNKTKTGLINERNKTPETRHGKRGSSGICW